MFLSVFVFARVSESVRKEEHMESRAVAALGHFRFIINKIRRKTSCGRLVALSAMLSEPRLPACASSSCVHIHTHMCIRMQIADGEMT